MEDVYDRVLLNMDIDTLQNACRTNKYHKFCNNFEFWIRKFYYDDVPILLLKLPTTSLGWIKEYRKVYNILIQVDDIFDNIMSDHQLAIDYTFNKKAPNIIFYDLLPKELLQYDIDYYYGKFIKLTMLKTTKNVELVLYINNVVHNITTLSYEEFNFMLTRLIYYVPKLNLIDTNTYINILDF